MEVNKSATRSEFCTRESWKQDFCNCRRKTGNKRDFMETISKPEVIVWKVKKEETGVTQVKGLLEEGKMNGIIIRSMFYCEFHKMYSC